MFLAYLSNRYRRHTLSRRRIVPLPRWKADPEMYPEALFPKKTVSRWFVVNRKFIQFWVDT